MHRFWSHWCAPLPREGDALIVRVRPGEVLRTSITAGQNPPTGEAWIEADGKRLPLPDDFQAQKQIYEAGNRASVKRYCSFYGTEDEADAAGDAPGFPRNPREAQGISREERDALIAFYNATNGNGWKHRVGWLGPPGTECSWHGINCGRDEDGKTSVIDLALSQNNLSGTIPELLGQLTHLKSLELSENNLMGTIPDTLSRPTHLERLDLFGNHFSGMLPGGMIQRWLSGALDVAAEDALFTDVSEIQLEYSATSLLCGWHQITLRSDGSVTLMDKRCRKATPDDRTTYCEVKSGSAGTGEFARLAWLLDGHGFYGFKPEYSLTITDSVFRIIRVDRKGKHYEVSEYAGGGPFELWVIQTAIEGVAASAEWNKLTTLPDCLSTTDPDGSEHN